MRLAQMWFFSLKYIRSYLLIMTLCSSFTYFILPYQNFNPSIVYSSLLDNLLPLTNRTIFIERNQTIRLGVVSAIYNNDYIQAIEVLAYSLRRVNIQADLILLYIPNRLNQSVLDRCQNIGWSLSAVDRIEPPRFAIIYPRFSDQYTKLRIWSLTDYDRILYLDADTLVIRNINELLIGKIFDDDQNDGLLAAVEDVWEGQIGPNFNAGVLLIRPNQTIFEDMLAKVHNMPAYGSYWAEQGFLNWYFKGSTGRLPLIYNFNVALAKYQYHRDIYLKLYHRIKIIHYTLEKPFNAIKYGQLSNDKFSYCWNLWYQIRDEMLNQSFISHT